MKCTPQVSLEICDCSHCSKLRPAPAIRESQHGGTAILLQPSLHRESTQSHVQSKLLLTFLDHCHQSVAILAQGILKLKHHRTIAPPSSLQHG
mmetsp:Transcript_5596/g.6538  ORF Transcript_5596/g.6538 Transcript_5596/m.6538 type:complete len:93 (+) Transcript_5596:120-398(+)